MGQLLFQGLIISILFYSYPSQELCSFDHVYEGFGMVGDDLNITEEEVSAGTTLKQTWEDGPVLSEEVLESSKEFLGKRMFSPRVGNLLKRKEYRQLTVKEMKLFHKALKAMKKSGEYDRIANQHSFHLARAAHFGVAFLPWHREYLDIFEQAIRNLDPKFSTVSIPFWDSPLDAQLPAAEDSILWTPDFFGTRYGKVTEGKMGKNWKVTESCQHVGKKLLRAVTNETRHLFSHAKLHKHLSRESMGDLMIARGNLPYSRFELDHGMVHCYVGECKDMMCTGHIACVECSPNDPIFWLLHSFVDSFWSEWASLPGKDTSYPQPGIGDATLRNMGGPRHLKYSPMSPFPFLINNDGLAPGYPTYEMRPSRIVCYKDEDCGSTQRLIFCHGCKCIGKIQHGGNCTGMPHKACYCSKKLTPLCIGGRCTCMT